MTPLIQNPGPARKLTGYYRLTAGAPAAPTVSPEIVPVALVDDLTQIDAGDPSYQRPYGAALSQAAVAAEYGYIDLLNPTASGVLAYIRSIKLFCGAATQFRLGLYQLAATVITARGNPRDTRCQAAACGLVAGTAPNPPTGNVFDRGVVSAASTLFEFDDPIIIQPTWHLRLRVDTVNVLVYASYQWEERSLLYLPQ